MSDNRPISGKKTSGVIRVAKWCFGIYITLVLIGILLIFIASEESAFMDALFMEFFEAVGIALMAGAVAALLASVAAAMVMLKSSWSVWAIIILLLSLPYVCWSIYMVVLGIR
jgi:hypothetical protein